ncbi:hypothetical protein HPB52_002555 [Rhipicephalus sanguineus]|uniref:Uncharacterized protein n=1 Tax=Rhipicephalus sanguineus TaxID=34632 RepID=A0A9D4PCP1_RHISA|nr:hypothetical protein HPB52_002555 [Rhipicephalus sanguineus]
MVVRPFLLQTPESPGTGTSSGPPSYPPSSGPPSYPPSSGPPSYPPKGPQQEQQKIDLNLPPDSFQERWYKK